jgi:transcriptional regulator with XRE-family HTH domain
MAYLHPKANPEWIAEIRALQKEIGFSFKDLARVASMKEGNFANKISGKSPMTASDRERLLDAANCLRYPQTMIIEKRLVEAYVDPEKALKAEREERMFDRAVRKANKIFRAPCDDTYINIVKVEYVTYPGRN